MQWILEQSHAYAEWDRNGEIENSHDNPRDKVAHDFAERTPFSPNRS